MTTKPEWTAESVAELLGAGHEMFFTDANLERIAARLNEMMAQQAASVPEGWKLVPINPTPEMLTAGKYSVDCKKVWKHMIAAAPQSPEQAGADARDGYVLVPVEVPDSVLEFARQRNPAVGTPEMVSDPEFRARWHAKRDRATRELWAAMVDFSQNENRK